MEDEATKHFDSLPDEKKHLIGTFCLLMCKLICMSSLKCFKKNICHSSNDEIYNINQLNNCHEYSRTCGLMDKHITNLCKSKEVIDAILRIYEKDEYYQILPPPIYKRFSVFCKPDTNDDKDTKETLLLLSNVIILMNFIKKVLTNKSDEKIKLFNVENKLRTLEIIAYSNHLNVNYFMTILIILSSIASPLTLKKMNVIIIKLYIIFLLKIIEILYLHKIK